MVSKYNDESPEVKIPTAAPAREQSQSEDVVEESLAHVRETGLIPTPISGTIRDLQEGGVRGQAGMALLNTIVSQLESRVFELTEEVKHLRDDLKNVERLYYGEREKVARMTERAQSNSRFSLFQSGVLALGGIILGSAMPNLSKPEPSFAIAEALIGGLLMIIGSIKFLSKGEN